MLTHEEMVGLHAEKHDLINAIEFNSIEAYVQHLIHSAAYAQAARLVEYKRVLDLGCNTGYGTDMLFRSAKKVVGVDVSEKAIVSARNQYGHLGIEFHTIDGKTLPFSDEAFDVVVCFQVIEHIVDYIIFIDEIKRILTPEGVIIFTTPNALLRLYPGMKPWNEFHVREFNHNDLKSLLDTFFKNVCIFGLFAIEPLYSIEVNRVARARDKAQSRTNKKNSLLWSSLRAYAKKMYPKKIKKMFKSFRKFFTQKPKSGFSALMNKYGVNDLYYHWENLESALDLLAVCCNNKKVFEKSVNTIKSSGEKGRDPFSKGA
jgi:2-polyprenyl-3-methyl-5-hydroxy-6-metoxy-1,4-benzoquinol methylase